MKKFLAKGILATAVLSLSPLLSFANSNFVPAKVGIENETPEELAGIGIDEKLGQKVNLDLVFTNEEGEKVRFGDLFKDGKPVLLSLAYYSCPSLCNFHLNGLNDAFKGLKKPIGSDFNFVVVSIEPKDSPAIAKAKKINYLNEYGRPESAGGWHFLTSDEASVRQLADQVGFKYRWDEKEKQWAHSAAAFVLTPDGQISRYLYGIVFDPNTIRLSMIEASNGKVGTLVDKLILYCFHFDPAANKYTLYAFNVMRAGGALTVLVMAVFLVPVWIRSRRESSDSVQGEV